MKDIETAIRAIENINGFDDPTSGVGEAWECVLTTIERLTAERDEAVRERDQWQRAFHAAYESSKRYSTSLQRIRDDAVDLMRENIEDDRKAASELESARQTARPSSEEGGG